MSASIGHPTSPSRPGHLPQPPDRVRARPVLHLEEPAALPPQLDDCSLKVVALRMAGARPPRILAGLTANPFPIMAGPAAALRTARDLHYAADERDPL